MEESEDNVSAEKIKIDDSVYVKHKTNKKRSLVERELETNLTARVTSPITNREAMSTSRYGRARRLKSESEQCDADKSASKSHKSPKLDKSPSKIQSPAYKMHASNSPIRIESPKLDLSLENQIENIYNENMSLSRFSSEENTSKSATKKCPKVYVRKDLIQSKDKKDDTVVLIKNMFSPTKSIKKPNSNISNYLELSTEKYNLKKPLNGYLNTSSVVKTLDFDGKKKKKDEKKTVLSKSELFDLEAQCDYQVGDLAWARMGTYPFWPCIITRDPLSGMFVKKKLFGRLERDVLHVTFFGDNGRRGWIVGTMLRKFLGQLEFETVKRNYTQEAKKKDPRLYSAFLISDKKMAQWQISVEEAEMMLREPKRLRIDILNDMLMKSREVKTTPKHDKRKKIARTNSDVSLSESLFDTLFSEDDSKGNDSRRSRSKSRNRSLDVSEVVTACLDNMAAKTGITKIQRQSHMDRWLQKAKSKTPEKSHLKSQLVLKIEKDHRKNNVTKLNKKLPKKSPLKKPYCFRKFGIESLSPNRNTLQSHHDEHDYSQKYNEINEPALIDDIEIEYENAEMFTSDVIEPGSGLGIISKVETLCGKAGNNDPSDVITNVSIDKLMLSDVNNENIVCSENQSQVCEKIEGEEGENNKQQSIEVKNEVKDNNRVTECVIDLGIVDFCNNHEPIQANKLETLENYSDNSCIIDYKSDRNKLKDSNGASYKDNFGSTFGDSSSNLSDKNVNKSLHDESTDNDIINDCVPCIESSTNTLSEINDDGDIDSTVNQDVPLMDTVVSENRINNEYASTKDEGKHLKNIDEFTCERSRTDISSSIDKSIIKHTTLIENYENDCVKSNNPAETMEADLSTPCVEVLNVVSLNACDNKVVNDTDTIGEKNKNQGILEASDLHESVTKQLFEADAEKNNLNNEVQSLGNSILIPCTDSSKLSLILKESCENNQIVNGISKTHPNVSAIVQIKQKSIDSSNEIVEDSAKELVSVEQTEKNLLLSKEECKGNFTDMSINKEGNTNDPSLMENKCPLPQLIDMSPATEIDSFKLGKTAEGSLPTISSISQENQDLVQDVNNKNARFENDLLHVEKLNSCCKEMVNSISSPSAEFRDTNLTHIDEDKLKCKNKEAAINTATEIIAHSVEEISRDKDFEKADIEKISLESDVCEESHKQTDLRTDCKLTYDVKEALKNSQFQKYLELKQDDLTDEHPELSEEEIINYLYKTWIYEESLKTDVKKTDEIQNASLVNGLKQSPIKIKLSLNKSSKKNKKIYKVELAEYINGNDQNHTVSAFESNDRDIIIKNHVQNINTTDINNKVVKNKYDCLSETKSSPKMRKRIKLNNHHKSNLNNFFTCLTKNNHSNNISDSISEERIEENISKDKTETKTCKEYKTYEEILVKSKINSSPIKNSNENENIEDVLHLSNTDTEKLVPKVSELNPEPCEKNLMQIELTPLSYLDTNTNSIHDKEKPQASHQVPLTVCKNQSAYVADGEITEINCNVVKKEADSTSEKSKNSENSLCNRKTHTKEKFSGDKSKQDFLNYYELRLDALIDEHPELTEEELTEYLYKTWLYEEGLKNDIKKADDIETVTSLVKGLNQKDPTPIKRVRKKNKAEKEEDCHIGSEDAVLKEKSKRKNIRKFYREDFSDIEDDIDYFETYQPHSKSPTPVSSTADTSKTDVIETVDDDAIDPNNEVDYVFDEVEEYFRQLTVPKPNIFKGLLREKVCDICEKVGNLIKCKGCHCMFHADCVKKETEVVEVGTQVRGRKKKKKSRGRKAKEHPNGQETECQSDPNVSDEIKNTSLDDELEGNVVANADDFEAQLSAKMKELLDNPENTYDCEQYLSENELDWDDIEYGECKIINVVPRKRDCEDTAAYLNFKCNNCQKYDTPVCFVCKSALSPKDQAENRQKCQVAHCHKYYHLECLTHWPQTQFVAGELSRINKNSKELVEALACPRHVCHTCVCDDPRGCKTRFSGDKLARCIRCPATYHTFTKCLPAGTQILTASHIICPRHYEHRPGKVPCHVNTGWCFICALGGTLICCEYCPTSFHAECLNIDPPEGGYMCEDCETGRLPLYGEMVWVKLGHYRWWPGIILHPCEIPLNILAVKHSLGEFVVRFFGQYDYFWVNRGRVFPFQEGDSGRITNQKSKIDAAFTMAMEHAQRACQILKTASPNEEESLDIASSLLPPHYVKLKVNKPCGSLCGKKIDIEESSLTQCECDPNEYDPCGPYTQCLNRMLLTECGPTCKAGDRCNNRAFEKRLYPKMVPYRTPHRGWGLKALEDIKAGQFVIEYVGELIDEEEFKRRMRRKQEVRDENFYYLTLDKERMIDAGPKGNSARFMNHSCEPNCETQKWTVLGDVRVGLFALYDIPANSELTFNYNLESTGVEKKQCMCGARRCSGYIGAKPKQDDQPKKSKSILQTKRTYKKRKNIELSPSTKPKQRTSRPYKPRELTEIEKDILIIKSATNSLSSDSDCSRLSIDSKDSKGLKRRRLDESISPSRKKSKLDKSSEAD